MRNEIWYKVNDSFTTPEQWYRAAYLTSTYICSFHGKWYWVKVCPDLNRIVIETAARDYLRFFSYKEIDKPFDIDMNIVFDPLASTRLSSCAGTYTDEEVNPIRIRIDTSNGMNIVTEEE